MNRRGAASTGQPPAGGQSRLYLRRDWLTAGGAGAAGLSSLLLMYLLSQVQDLNRLVTSQGQVMATFAASVVQMQSEAAVMRSDLAGLRREGEARDAHCAARVDALGLRVGEVERGLAECQASLRSASRE